jgi:hypothetical protein
VKQSLDLANISLFIVDASKREVLEIGIEIFAIELEDRHFLECSLAWSTWPEEGREV